MKYVALLSGGKDSCYNLMHCYRNGHQLVAAASLGPGQGKDEIDSYMYQTVGQDAIELVAQALDVPLFRRVISGSALNMGSDYGSRTASENRGIAGDETEDLFALLSDVKSSHPEIEGVSVGAILSTYQRVRVEHVCRRLSLTPLCYLWQRDQAELLSEMVTAGLEAVLIKVAGMGLTTRHLGQTLAQMQPTLIKLNAMYELHICGEGGEYETLTLNCPLFKRRIKLIETETVIHSDNDFASVAYLKILNAALEEKPDVEEVASAIPPVLEDHFLELQEKLQEELPPLRPQPDIGEVAVPLNIPSPGSTSSGWVVVAEVQSSHAAEQSIEEEAKECFAILLDRLQEHGLDYHHCTNINLFISSMEFFGRINAVYSTFFGSNPPARACVAIDLPDPCRIKLECVAYAEQVPEDRYALHVQGLSYWAPANIGPYSQAVVVDDQAFISGQIGMQPSNLSLPSPQSLALETALACQHVSRVLGALRSHNANAWKGYTQLALYWLEDPEHLPRVRHAVQGTEAPGTPTLYVVVAALPKGALVEKQVVVHTGRCYIKDEDGEVETHVQDPSRGEGDIIEDNGAQIHREFTSLNDIRLSTLVCFRGTLSEGTLVQIEQWLNALNEGTFCARLFYRASESVAASEIPFLLTHLPITTIPARLISTNAADDWDYALCILTL